MNRILSIAFLTSYLLLMASCSDEACTAESWEGSYVGTMICNEVVGFEVIVTVDLGFEGLLNISIGNDFNLELYPDECENSFEQKGAFINDYTASSYTISLEENEINWERRVEKDQIVSVCRGVFVRQ